MANVGTINWNWEKGFTYLPPTLVARRLHPQVALLYR
jgi:hypothetical protein